MSVEEYYHMALYKHMEGQHASRHCIWQYGCSNDKLLCKWLNM